MDTLNASTTDLRDDLRPTARVVAGTLVPVGTILYLAAVGTVLPFRVQLFAALVLALAVSIWLLDRWNPQAGRWSAVVAVLILTHLLDAWLLLPGAAALIAIPTALAAALIGLRAATLVALGDTVLLLSLPFHGTLRSEPAAGGATLAAIWLMLGVMLIAYRSVYQLAAWSWQHYRQARSLLEEARSGRVQLKQALDDLAHANRQLALTNDKLAAARLAAEEAQKAKAAFVANVSHELRTPLNMIIGLTDLLLETPQIYGQELPPPLLQDLEIVRRNCEHLAGMVDDVLDLSQVEAGRMALHKERVDLAEVIDRALAVVRPLLEKKGLRLQVDTPAQLPQVYCDRTRIRQVIVNLLSNAARFTESGGITVQTVATTQHVEVSVRDTGPGVSDEDARRIFEPFAQGTDSTLRRRGGSGLGLSISKHFVELHGGQMRLKSAAGAGSTFTFRLPVSPPIEPELGPGRWLAEAWSWIERTSRSDLPLAAPRPRMVIWDGSGELASLFTRYSDDIEFVAAPDLNEVSQEVQRGPAQAILINAASPDDLCASAERARHLLGDTPVIGFCLPPRDARALAAGAIGYLTKPVTRAKLQQAMESVGRPVRRVLVVEDDEDARQLFARMLYACDSSIEVVKAANGRRGLDELRTHHPDLILLDIVLPDIDGWQVLEAKCQDQALRDIPTILVSAQDPADRPVGSSVLLATLGAGLSVGQLLRCSRALPALLLQPGSGPGPEPSGTAAARRA